MTRSVWLHSFSADQDCRLRLVCFPHAGGGVQSFASWKDLLPTGVSLHAVALPGRESRLQEPPVSQVEELIAELIPALLPLSDRPLVFYGHSLGALLAYAAACTLETEHGRSLDHLIVSGRVAAHAPLPRDAMHLLPDDQFIAALRELDGTPQEILDSPEMMRLLTPMLRADFTLNETFDRDPLHRLSCDMTAIGGLWDPHAPRAGLHQWRELTHGSFRLSMVPGNHFFIHSAQALFLRLISVLVYRVISQRSSNQVPLNNSSARTVS